jgi:hypothetical protein
MNGWGGEWGDEWGEGGHVRFDSYEGAGGREVLPPRELELN